MSKPNLTFLIAIIAMVVGSLLIIAYFDKLVIAALTPSVRFDAATVPPPPTYAARSAWSALPSEVDAADAEITTLVATNQASAPVDLFYIHPTSYVGRAWNAQMDDETVNSATDLGATRIQASAFNGCCAIYAPRYRQANLTPFVHPSVDGRQAIELAGSDVIAAFRYYLEHYNQGRPFLIAAHSQGSVHAFRLLTEVVVGSEVQQRLVVAYLIGSPLTEATLSAYPTLPICADATDTGCVVAWNARSPAYRGGIDFVESEVTGNETTASRRVCVNPLTWRYDEDLGDFNLNRGAVFWDESGDPPTPRPGFANARCGDGWLRLEMIGRPPRDFASRLLDYALGNGNYHPIEYGLFFVNLGENAQARIDEFLR